MRLSGILLILSANRSSTLSTFIGGCKHRYRQEKASAEIRGEFFRTKCWVNFAGDFLVDFFLLLSHWKKTGGKNPPKNPRQNSNQNWGVSRPKSTLLGESSRGNTREIFKVFFRGFYRFLDFPEVFRDFSEVFRSPLRNPLRGRFPSPRLSVLLPLFVLPLELSSPNCKDPALTIAEKREENSPFFADTAFWRALGSFLLTVELFTYS